mgnify:CR=1 FL=1
MGGKSLEAEAVSDRLLLTFLTCVHPEMYQPLVI